MSASLNPIDYTLTARPGTLAPPGFYVAPSPAPEVPMPRPPKPDHYDAAQKWILEACDLLDQVAGILDKTKRLRMLTRSEDHLELMNSQARHITAVMRALALRAENFL